MHSRRSVVGVAIAALVWLMGVGAQTTPRHHAEETHDLAAWGAQAARLVEQATRVLRHAREEDDGWDPASRFPAGEARDSDRVALVGDEVTPLVTTLGHLDAKWLSTDPRWASALVRELSSHGVAPGDVVTASFSGSFPGLNLSLMAACRAMGVRLVAVSSVTASTWGANEPGFTWPEMEVRVVEAGVLPAASVAIGVGGSRDAGRDLEPEARALARRIQRSTALRLRAEALETTTLEEAIDARMAAYDRALTGRQPSAYVNIGGNHASLGGARADLRHAEGWHLGSSAERAAPASGTISIFSARGVPVLNLLNVVSLAREWGVAAAPDLVAVP